jgi:molybdate transport system permease protein
VAFFAVPLVGLLQRTGWATLWEDLTAPTSLEALRLSLVCSIGATAASLVLGTPLAYTLARVRFPGRAVVRALVLLPMVLPPVVGGVALLAAFSRRSPLGGWLYDVTADGGWLAWLPGGPVQLTFSTPGAVAAATFVALPFYVLTAEAALRSVDRRYEEVAASLGAGPVTVFRRVTVPLVAPALAAGAVLAWARALGEFGATITFAGNVEGRTRTLPLAVYLRLESDQQGALALSLLLLVVSLGVLVALRDRWLVGV